MNKHIKMAIVGVGIWGENHARVIQSYRDASVIAMLSRS